MYVIDMSSHFSQTIAMSTQSLPLQPSQAASPPFQQPISDEVFHLAPLLMLDHHTISPVYYSPIHLPDVACHWCSCQVIRIPGSVREQTRVVLNLNGILGQGSEGDGMSIVKERKKVLDIWCARYVAYGLIVVYMYMSVFVLVLRVQYIYWARD